MKGRKKELSSFSFCWRQGDYKLIVGFPGLYSGWYFPNETVSKVETMNTSDLSGLTMTIPQQDSLSWPRAQEEVRLYNVRGVFRW